MAMMVVRDDVESDSCKRQAYVEVVSGRERRCWATRIMGGERFLSFINLRRRE
jgi:hypothetical protein